MIWDIQLRPHDISLTNATNKTLIELSTSSNAVERVFVARVVVIALVVAKIFDAAAHLTAAGGLIIRLLFGVRPSEARTAQGEATIGAAVAELGRHFVRFGAHGVTLPMTFIGGLVNTKNALLAQTTFGLGARTFKQVKVTVDPALEPIPVVPRLPEPTPEPVSQGIEVEEPIIEEDVPPESPKEQTQTAAPVRENTEDVQPEEAPIPDPVERDIPPPPPAPPPMPEKPVKEESPQEERETPVDAVPPKTEEKIEEVQEEEQTVEEEPATVVNDEEKVDTDKGEATPSEEEASTDESFSPPPPPPPVFDNLSTPPLAQHVFKRPKFGLKKAASIAAFDRSTLKKANRNTKDHPKEPQSSGSESIADIMRKKLSSRRSSMEQNLARDPEVKALLTSIVKAEDVWEDDGNVGQFDELVKVLFPENDEELEGLETLENELTDLADLLKQNDIDQSLKSKRILSILPEEKPGEGTDALEVYERLKEYAHKRQFKKPDGSFTKPSFSSGQRTT